MQRGRSGISGGGGGRYAGVGPRDFQRSPDLIGDEVVIVLTADPDVDATDITVIVDDDGTVTLIGTVDADDDAQRAGDLAGSVPGVTDVRNQLNTSDTGGGRGSAGGAGGMSGRQLADRGAGAGAGGGAGGGRGGGGFSGR
jgi:hypothetical protein